LNRQPRTIGILETTGFTPAIVALDAMEKGFQISVLQAELNDMLGVCIKILGDVSQVNTALETGRRVADRLKGSPVATTLALCEAGTFKVLNALPEYNPLIQQDVVHLPKGNPNMVETKETIAALGFIETQGFTAVFEAIDTACKSANVEVVGKEKLGGGYVTVIVKGDVAAVNTAVATGSKKVEALGNLVAAHVVTRPSPAVLCLLP
jgi:carbon dioxide concentrating mechanism protein CcmO